MSLSIPVPAAEDDTVEHADWVELEAIQSEDGACSLVELIRQIHRGGSTDAVPDLGDYNDAADRGGNLSEQVALDAWAEIESRLRACGGEDGQYPFEVTAGSIVLRERWEDSPYVFQLLLTRFGHRAGPRGTYPERIFEVLSAIAGRGYLGGDANRAESYVFGFPRPDGTGFVEALTKLCGLLNAGQVKLDDPQIENEKDSHLDVVVWRPFHDRFPSQLIMFGQCAVGENWQRSKLTELHPRNFRDKWLAEGFYPDPIRMFFVPRCVEERQRRMSAIEGGILFERCRITELVGNSQHSRQDRMRKWTCQIADKLRRRS